MTVAGMPSPVAVLYLLIRPWALFFYFVHDLPAWPYDMANFLVAPIVGSARRVVQGLIVIGGLALPIYAFHESVIPTKDILVGLGVSGGVALAVPLALFSALFLYLCRRLRRIYFA
jgi:hypothetical protein